MRFLSGRFPTLSRHLSVLAESWRGRKEAERAFTTHSDHEFLPAALEIMEKPPSPGLRLLMLALCGIFVITLVWSFIGRVDVVAVASGKTVPSSSVKVIQPIEIGAVRAIHVKNGQFVKKGDLLIELDPTLASADEAQSEQTLLTAQVRQARGNTLMAHLEGRSVIFKAPASTPTDVIATENAFVQTAIAQYEAQRASLVQQRAEMSADLARAEAEIAKLREALPYIEQQLQARIALTEEGYFSKLKLLEYEQLRAEHIRNVDVQRAGAQRARASIGRIDAELTSLRQNFANKAVGDLADANDRAGLAGEELRKSARRRQYQELRSPVDGVVQQLAITTVGGVVQPAQALMVLVPCGRANAVAGACNDGIEVEAFVQNKDIGFVKEGQRVVVKLEAFNFTDFGMIEGTVAGLSRDAIDQSQEAKGSARDANGRPVQNGLVYAARIHLDCRARSKRRSRLCDRAQPGMSVQAEIKTGTRRIIDFLLSPIMQAMDEAGRER